MKLLQVIPMCSVLWATYLKDVFHQIESKGGKNLVLNIILKLKQSIQTQEIKGDYWVATTSQAMCLHILSVASSLTGWEKNGYSGPYSYRTISKLLIDHQQISVVKSSKNVQIRQNIFT